MTATTPFLLPADTLQALASEEIYARGVAYADEHRVTELVCDGGILFATVDGKAADYDVQILVDEQTDQLRCICPCPFDWEPFCKHAIATLVAWVQTNTAADVDVSSASAQAIADRRKRAAADVKVEHVGGQPHFGTWTARTISAGAMGRQYRVEVMSLASPINTCTCPDFALNQLGTCKHIEAVRLRLGRQGVRREDEPAVAVAWLDWRGGNGPVPRVHAPDGLPEGLAAALDRCTDADGLLRGADAAAVFHVARLAEQHDALTITHDLLAWAEQGLQAARATTTAERLRARIARHGGQLPGIKARLYPYQVEGVSFLVSRGRAVLADDMGLGKTLQTIAACRVLMDEAGVERIVVVCPASLKSQWSDEIRQFAGLSVQIVQGNAQQRLAQYRRRATFTIINYELVLREADTLQRELAPDVLVLDEAQRIRNWQTKTAAAVKTIDTRYAFVLTGTPLENRLVDLYSIMQVVDSRVLGPLWRFMVDFHVTDEHGKPVGYRNLSELRRRLAPVMLRRNRDVVADQLPERKVVRRDLKMTARQRDLHDGALSSAQNIMQIARRQKRPLTPSESHRLMASLQQARMACNAAGLVDKVTEGSPKLTELRELLSTLCLDEGRKVVVFSQWERMTAMAEEVARELGIGTVRLHGSVPTAKRAGLIRSFEQDPDIGVFLSTDAGATGLNLQAASALINLELPFNPALLEQRIGRVHRLGQRENCLITLLVSAGSYEERIWQLLGGKRDLFAAVVSGESDEDVVGMDAKAMQLAMEAANMPDREPVAPVGALGVDDDEPADDAVVEPEADVTDELTADKQPQERSARPSMDDPRSLAPLVARLQALLGARLQRLFVAGSGLVAIVDVADEATHNNVERECAELMNADSDQRFPVAVVDPFTWRSLQRLQAGPAAPARELELPAPEPEVQRSPLLALAERKLKAAEVLIEQGCASDATGLLRDACVAALVGRAGKEQAPQDAELVGWLYGEAVPGGLVASEDAAMLMRLMGLASVSVVPDAVVQGLQREVVSVVFA